MKEESKTSMSLDYSSKPDFLLKFSEAELDDLDSKLTQEEEKIFKDILELEKQNQDKKDIFQELLEAAKKGASQFVDSMTDTVDTLTEMKDPKKVKNLRTEEINIKRPSANPSDPKAPRTMKEASQTPFDKNVPGSTNGMDPKGAELFQKHVEAYSQRVKSITAISKEKESLNYRTDQKVNDESLSGLRGYRVGPVVPTYSVDEIKRRYDQENQATGQVMDNTSNWLMSQNFDKFQTELMKEYGFKSKAAAQHWIRENHLTIHEGPDGMYLVPRDIHDVAGHSGYRSLMTSFLKGEINKDQLNNEITREKIEYVKHEAVTRGTRLIKGIGLSVIKDILKCAIVAICKETHNEFKIENEDKFIDRISRVLKNTWLHVKARFQNALKNIWSNIKGSILSELLTALNDFLFGTFKNIFKIIRQMWGSIKSAFQIIFSRDKNISFGERVFEASKILSAGIVGILGFSLNEIIEKGLTFIGIPFASFISECLSGLFSAVMSAIVIMLFDRLKKHFLEKSNFTEQIINQYSKSLNLTSAKISISSLRVDMKMYETYNFIGTVFLSMQYTHNDIVIQEEKARGHTSELKEEVTKQKRRINELENLKKIANRNK